MDIQTLIATEQRTAVERWIESRARGEYVGNDVVLARVLGKYLMQLKASDLSLTPRLLFDGYWEMWTTIAIARFLKPGMHCADVGANVGYFTLAMADWVGPQGHVFSLEPQSDLEALLDGSLRINGLDSRSFVSGVVASDGSGFARISNPGAIISRNYGCAAFEACEATDPHQVPRARLDDPRVIPELQINLVKLDCEGHEPEVWTGMEGIRARSPALNVVMEFSPKLYPDPVGFYERLLNDGFHSQQVADDGSLHAVGWDELCSRDWTMLWLAR